EDRAALHPEVDAVVVEGHALAHDREPRRLGEAVLLQLPARPAVTGAVDAEPAVAGDAVLGALLWDDPGDVRVGRVERDREAEPARQAVPLEPLPRVAVVVGAVDAAMVLLPQPAGTARVGEQLVHALAHVRERVVREEVGGDALVDRRPALAAVVAPEGARGRDRGVDPVVRELDRVAAEAAGPRLPALAGRVLEEAVD